MEGFRACAQPGPRSIFCSLAVFSLNLVGKRPKWGNWRLKVKIFRPRFDKLCPVAIQASPGPRTEDCKVPTAPTCKGSEAFWHFLGKNWFQSEANDCQWPELRTQTWGPIANFSTWCTEPLSGEEWRIPVPCSAACSFCVCESRKIIWGAIDSTSFWLSIILFSFCLSVDETDSLVPASAVAWGWVDLSSEGISLQQGAFIMTWAGMLSF